MNSRGSSKKESLNGSSLKTSRGCSTATTGKISKESSKSWTNSGTVFRGEFSTQNISEHPSVVVESTLSEVLETSAPLKYFLTPQQLQSLLNRAAARRTSLPENLERCMELQISTLSNMRESTGSPRPVPKQKATATTAKHTRSTLGGPRTLYVRRLLPSECEKLQGFPPAWTEIDIERLATQFAFLSRNGSPDESG